MKEVSLAIINANVITMNPSYPYVEAIAIDNDKIFEIGSNEKIKTIVGSKTKIINAKGKTILPGFIDCHVHLMQTGIDMMKIDFSLCKSISNFKQLIHEKLKEVTANQWILGIGYNEFNFIEKTKPNIEEIDEITDQNPIFISRVDHHSAIVNSMAIKKLKFPQNIKGVAVDKNGKLEGYIFSDANSYARQYINKLIDKKTRREALKKASKKLLSVGVTSIHALEGGSLFSDDDVDIILEDRSKLPIGIKLYYQTTDVKKVIDKGLKQIGGCLLIDGSIGSRTAALSQSYEDDKNNYGNLYYEDKEIEDFVLEAHSKGLQISTHAIGDAAIEQILKAHEKAQSKFFRENSRHRIEHFGLPAPSHIDRSIKQGIILSVQPPWSMNSHTLNTTVGPARLGKERAKRLWPIASPFIAGAKMCGGSDSPITESNPLLGICGAVNHFRKEERLSRMALLSFYTTNAAWTGFEEKIKGKIKPGYVADLIILERDLFEVKDEEIKDIKIHTTISKGIIRYMAVN